MVVFKLFDIDPLIIINNNRRSVLDQRCLRSCRFIGNHCTLICRVICTNRFILYVKVEKKKKKKSGIAYHEEKKKKMYLKNSDGIFG